MKRLYYAAFGSLLVVIFLFFQGCGDTNVFEGMSDDGGEAARVEQAKQDLNSGNFDAVIDALNNKTSLTEQESRYLASAYMGKAGFDTLKLLEEIAKDDENGNKVDTFQVITSMFGGTNGSISSDQLQYKMGLINDALRTLESASQKRNARFSKALVSSSPSDDVPLQKGIYAAVHAIFTICETIDCEYKNIEPVLLYVPLTISALKEYLSKKGIGTITLSAGCLPTTLDQDLQWVQEAVNALSGGSLDGNLPPARLKGNDENDVQKDFDKFLGDIGYNDVATPNEVKPAELSGYLNGLLNPASNS